jgi:hypothetical protein
MRTVEMFKTLFNLLRHHKCWTRNCIWLSWQQAGSNLSRSHLARQAHQFQTKQHRACIAWPLNTLQCTVAHSQLSEKHSLKTLSARRTLSNIRSYTYGGDVSLLACLCQRNAFLPMSHIVMRNKDRNNDRLIQVEKTSTSRVIGHVNVHTHH